MTLNSSLFSISEFQDFMP